MAKKSKAVQTETVSEAVVKPTVEPSFVESDLFWRIGSALVLVTAIALRFYDLALKPFHHDEGVNGFFLTNLVRNGVYKYDPSNYHGPTLYFAAQASSYLFGLNDFAVRSVTALFGVLTVAGVLYLRRYLGSVGALTAAALVALSPGMVFISRYFIHEMLFVFFTLGVVLGVLRFFERERAGSIAAGLKSILLLICLLPGTINFAKAVGGGNLQLRNAAFGGFFLVSAALVGLLMWFLIHWHNGRPIYLMLAAASLILTFATKETAFISFGTIIIAVACTFVWQQIIASGETDKKKKAADKSQPEASLAAPFPAFSPGDALLTTVICVFLFVYVGALFFSSFFTYPEGIWAAFEAYSFWTKTGSKDHTTNGFFAYFKWLWLLEPAILLLAAGGAAWAVWKRKDKFALFAALWAFGLLAAYTLIPYKTPWLAVNFILPLALTAGYAVNQIAIARRETAVFLAAMALSVCAYQTVELNFYQYDNNDRPYVYAHTKRDFLKLVKEIEAAATTSGEGKEVNILVVSPEYWALPWYLRDYPNTAFYGQIQPANDAEIIVGSTEQETELAEKYGANYVNMGTYPLRPKVFLTLYARRDIAQKMTAK